MNVTIKQAQEKGIGVYEYPKANSLQEAKNWLNFGFKVGVGSISAFALSQVAYSYFLSPSYESQSQKESSTLAFYNKYANNCTSLAFKLERSLFNSFETWSSFYRLFGFTSEPPGDMQGFLLDQNFPALKCAYPSTHAVSVEAKNRLLQNVLERMSYTGHDLTRSLEWLIQQGANPNLQAKVSSENLRRVHESALTPLMAAYRAHNVALFEFLLSRNASVSQRLYSYSKQSNQWDQNQPLFLALINDIIRSNATEPDRCSFYKKVVDLALAAAQKEKDFSGLSAEKLRHLTYCAIGEHHCSKTFLIEKEKEQETEGLGGDTKAPTAFSRFVGQVFSAAKTIFNVFKKWVEGANFFMASDENGMNKEQALKILLLSDDATGAMIKKRIRELELKYHPDKNRHLPPDLQKLAAEKFIAVQAAKNYFFPRKTT